MSVSKYLEIPKMDSRFPFRCFIDYGKGLVYPHWHKEIEIIYVIKGTIKIGVNDELITVNEGQIYFFDSGATHYFLATPESERLVYQFDSKMFNEGIETMENGQPLKEIFASRENWSLNWPREIEDAMCQHLQKLYDETLSREVGYVFAAQQHLYGVLALLSRKVPEKSHLMKKALNDDSMKNKETLERMDKVFALIEANYNQGITLEEVAKYVGFSPHYFTRFFKKNTGTTFVGFLTEYRINMAKSILGTEEMPMIEVAERSGFNSVKTFHHVFKENVGMSPLKYQKSIFGN